MNKCLYCKKKTTNPKFCSLFCSSKGQSKPIKNKDKTRTCKTCHMVFQYRSVNQKFCSRSCAAKVNNIGKNRVNQSKIVKGNKASLTPCLNCNKITNNRRMKLYCSSKCSGEHKNKVLIGQWLKDPNSTNIKDGLSRTVRLYLIKEAGYRCSQCGWGEINKITGKSSLEVDHINGDCYNNVPQNLRVLCPNCHSLTETYKALNKNSKRIYRKEYNNN